MWRVLVGGRKKEGNQQSEERGQHPAEEVRRILVERCTRKRRERRKRDEIAVKRARARHCNSAVKQSGLSSHTYFLELLIPADVA